ncbi:MAG: hypothetical protein ACKO9B_10960 [Planctomycetota bacterium]|jgi:hypothetical protein|nr:hypothetical protein [Planctomycetota bacterium]
MRRSTLLLSLLAVALSAATALAAGDGISRVGDPKPLPHGTPQRMAPWGRGTNPSVTRSGRWRYWVNPTQPRTPTWRAYSFPPGVKPGDWPVYAPFGFGGYRFPAVGNQAYR